MNEVIFAVTTKGSMQVCRQVFVVSEVRMERVAEILQRQSQGRIPLIDL